MYLCMIPMLEIQKQSAKKIGRATLNTDELSPTAINSLNFASQQALAKASLEFETKY